MWSVSQLCRCTLPLRAVQSKLLVSGTRNGFNSSNQLTRQLYTPFRNGQSNKAGFKRISELLKRNMIVVRLTSSAPKPQGGTPKAVGYWLLGCSGMVFAAVVLGMVAGYLTLLYSIYFVVKVALKTTNGSK